MDRKRRVEMQDEAREEEAHAANDYQDLEIAEKANFGRRCGPRMRTAAACCLLEVRRVESRWPSINKRPLPGEPAAASGPALAPTDGALAVTLSGPASS